MPHLKYKLPVGTRVLRYDDEEDMTYEFYTTKDAYYTEEEMHIAVDPGYVFINLPIEAYPYRWVKVLGTDLELMYDD